MSYKRIEQLSEFDIHFKGYQHMTELTDNKIVFKSFHKHDLNINRLRDYLNSNREVASQKFEDWDARYCEFEMEVPEVLEKPISGSYIINTEGKYGYDTNTYLSKLLSGELMDDGFMNDTPEKTEIFHNQWFPERYFDFKRFKLWSYVGFVWKEEPFTTPSFLLFEKIITKRPIEIPCYITYCFIYGVIDCLIIRNKNFTLTEALEVVLYEAMYPDSDGDCKNYQLPPSYKEACEKEEMN